MDASNEFKVFLSPSSGSDSKGKKGESDSGAGVRQRLVPVINKVFSPSHFMLAQRKTTVYKAVSGVSFQDIDIGGKRKSSSNKREKKDRNPESKRDGIYNPASEGELSLQSTKSERVRSFLGVREGRAAARRHRHSLGSNSDRPSTFLSDSDKLAVKKSRVRSASTVDNMYLSKDKAGDAPEKPQRSRSASRPRKSVSKVSVGGNTGPSEKGKGEEEDEKKANDAGPKDSVDNKKDKPSSDEARSRSRKKTGKNRKSHSTQHDHEKAKEEEEDEEPEGGYFSLEKEERGGGEIKFIYDALPSTSGDEYLENDQCVEAIYVCQAMRRGEDEAAEEPIYENCDDLVKANNARPAAEQDEDQDTCPVTQQGKEEEQDTSNRAQEEEGHNLKNIAAENPLALTRSTATQARLSRRRPMDSVDSIPFIDDSDHSGDDSAMMSPASPRMKAAGGVTVVTIKEDDNMEVTRKAGPMRTKSVARQPQEGADEAMPEGGGLHVQVQAAGSAEAEEEEADSAPRRPTRYSYPATSPAGVRLCSKVGRRLARHTPASAESRGSGTYGGADARVKKSMSHSDVQTHVEGRDAPLSESFSDDDIRHNEEFESFSETDSDLNNLDYDLFLPRGGRGSRSPVKTKRKPRGRSLSASQADPLLTFTPARAPRALPRRRISAGVDCGGGSGCLQSPKTFQDLLGDKYLNPPEAEAAAHPPQDGQRLQPLVIREAADPAAAPESAAAVPQATEHVVADDCFSFTWSDAESEFEFIDFNKVEPPKTCVVYQGLAAACAMVALTTTTSSTTTSTTTSTTVTTDKKLAGAVKRTQSMKGQC